MSIANIQASPVFSYAVEVHPVAALPGTYSFTARSCFAGSRDPQPRVVFQPTLDRGGMLALRNLIDSEVTA